MAIQFQCPICASAFVAPDEFAGSQARCGGCGNVVDVPRISAGASLHSSPATASVPAHPVSPAIVPATPAIQNKTALWIGAGIAGLGLILVSVLCSGFYLVGLDDGGLPPDHPSNQPIMQPFTRPVLFPPVSTPTAEGSSAQHEPPPQAVATEAKPALEQYQLFPPSSTQAAGGWIAHDDATSGVYALVPYGDLLESNTAAPDLSSLTNRPKPQQPRPSATIPAVLPPAVTAASSPSPASPALETASTTPPAVADLDALQASSLRCEREARWEIAADPPAALPAIKSGKIEIRLPDSGSDLLFPPGPSGFVC